MYNIMETITNKLRNALSPIANIIALHKNNFIHLIDFNQLKLSYDSIIKIIEKHEKESEWIKVDSYKDLPLNTPVIVKVHNMSSIYGYTLQIAVNDDKCPMIGHYFAWDCDKVIAYKTVE